MKFLTLLILISFSFAVNAQDIYVSDAINDCSGAVNIINPGTFQLQFSGKGGIVEDLGAYPSLKSYPEKNSVWCSYKAPYKGRFTLEATSDKGSLKMIVFQNISNNICEDISHGTAEIKRMITAEGTHVGLNLVTSDQTLYPIDLEAGNHILICFLGDPKDKSHINLSIEFVPTDGELKETSEGGKLLDVRSDKSETGMSVLVRDAETGLPVVANITVEGMKSLSATYSASDVLMTVIQTGKIKFKVDAEGYFFTDREEPVSQGTDNEVVIWLEPLGEGKSLQIDEIEFVPGSSEFLASAEPKLRRLKDFLSLNSFVKVEIQGHVHSTGENTFAGQKLSEARAKRVMNYLIENGIDKERMTAVGYGNTLPIYKDAKFSYEEQANRRVEVKIL